MEFRPAEPTQAYDVHRWVSETGRWELGVRRVIYGWRVSLGLVGEPFYLLDYCAADQSAFVLNLLAVVAMILEGYPEEATPNQVSQGFPSYGIKPINRDPFCWNQLLYMAIAQPPCVTCPKCQLDSYDLDDIRTFHCAVCGDWSGWVDRPRVPEQWEEYFQEKQQ